MLTAERLPLDTRIGSSGSRILVTLVHELRKRS